MATKSEKRRIEQAYPFILLYLMIKGGAIINCDDKLKIIQKEIDLIVDEDEKKRKVKFSNRVARINIDLGLVDTINKGIHGHKFIFIIYNLMELIDKNCNLVFPLILEKLFNFFLDVENKQNISDEEWVKLRKSGEKQAKKWFLKLQEMGFYN